MLTSSFCSLCLFVSTIEINGISAVMAKIMAKSTIAFLI